VNARLLYLIAGLAIVLAGSVHAQPLEAQLLKIAALSQARRNLVLAPVTHKPVRTQIRATAIIEPDAGAVAEVTSEIPARGGKADRPTRAACQTGRAATAHEQRRTWTSEDCVPEGALPRKHYESALTAGAGSL
jgi:hypothetical protein